MAHKRLDIVEHDEAGNVTTTFVSTLVSGDAGVSRVGEYGLLNFVLLHLRDTVSGKEREGDSSWR
jgi:hypothetical protein